MVNKGKEKYRDKNGEENEREKYSLVVEGWVSYLVVFFVLGLVALFNF